jgi:hypothetical protein
MRRALVPWAAGALLALPIALFRYPPMADLGMHEALVSILRHLHDPAWAPPDLYFVVAPQANQLFHFVACALSFAAPTDVACKLVVALTVGAIPPLTARLLASLGRATWPALLLAPIAYGWMFRWGLVSNLTGYALLLFAWPLIERLARRPSAARALGAALAACLVFFAHESAALTFALIAGYFALVRARDWRGLGLRLAPSITVAALAAVQWRVANALLGANMRVIGNDFGADPIERVGMLPGAIFGGIGATRLTVVAVSCGLALAANMACKVRRRPRRFPLPLALWRYRYALLALVLALLYLVFPMSVGGSTMVAHRFLPGAWACLVVATAPRDRTGGPTNLRACFATALAAVVPIVVVGASWKAFASAAASHRALDEILTHVPMNVAVAQLDLTPKPAGRVAPVPGAAGRVQAERGGRMLFAFTDMPPYPVYVATSHQWSEPLLRLEHAPYAFMPTHDLRRFAFLLERNESPKAKALVEEALAPEAEVVARSGEWTLFHSRLPTVAVDAPDATLPAPPPEMLVERVNRLADARARP